MSTGSKGRRYPPEVLSSAEVRALLVACGGTTFTGIRNSALLVVMWRSGLRCSEALDLKPADVNFAAGSIRVRSGKGGKSRTVGCDAQGLDHVRAWLGMRQAAGVESDYLFCTRDGGRLASRYVRALMTRLGKQAGIGHRVHPHSLRHTMATESVREGVPITRISKQLGHSSISTTQTYVDHLHPMEVVDTYRARTW